MDTRIILAITVMIIILVIILFVVVNIGGRRIDISKRTEILKRLEELGLATGSLEGSTRRDAVVKLDNLLSKALQIKYNNTLSCGDNLKKAKDFFSKKDYNDLWNVHKTRNSIVHDDYEITEEEADEVFKIYKSNIIKILK